MQVLFWFSISVLLYTYLGYAALIALLARIRSRPGNRRPVSPRLSLPVAAYIGRHNIVQKLKHSLSLDYPWDRLEILLASDGSTDRTVEIARQYEGRGLGVERMPDRVEYPVLSHLLGTSALLCGDPCRFPPCQDAPSPAGAFDSARVLPSERSCPGQHRAIPHRQPEGNVAEGIGIHRAGNKSVCGPSAKGARQSETLEVSLETRGLPASQAKDCPPTGV